MTLIARVRSWIVPAIAVALLPVAPALSQAPAPAGLPDFTTLVEQAAPAVVNIRTTARLNPGQQFGQAGEGEEGDPFNEFFRRFFPNPGPQQRPGPQVPRPPQDRDVPRGLGSGFIISSDGFLLTNAHVVFGADEILVTFPDRREMKARLVGSDPQTDVALLKVEATGLTALRIGDPARLKVGEWVIAIGSSFGLDSTVTAGIVSAKDRDTNDLLQFIQTDVAVNPGNSGGPLINMRGEVVGINSQIITTSGGFNGISLSIPINEAMRVADQLRTTGRVVRGRIGVTFGEVTRDVAEAIGLPRAQGALVTSVEKDGPAGKAGVEAGDVILRFDGRPIDRSRDLQRIVFSLKPTTKTNLSVWRKGQQRELTITVAELPEPPRPQARRGDTPRSAVPANALGLTVSDVPAERLKELQVRGAVQVDGVDGAAARAGVRQGDVIISVNNTDVTGARQFNDLVAKADPKKPVALLVQRGDQRTFLIVRPTER